MNIKLQCAYCNTWFTCRSDKPQVNCSRKCSTVYYRERSESAEARLRERLSIPAQSEACWELTHGFKNRGYGTICVEGRMEYCHRLAFSLWKHPIPLGLDVLHGCDNPGCCNPQHLFLGTQLDNNKDRHSKGRYVGKKGEHHGQAKLNESQVREIHGLPKKGQKEIGERYGISKHVVSNIQMEKAWKHLWL